MQGDNCVVSGQWVRCPLIRIEEIAISMDSHEMMRLDVLMLFAFEIRLNHSLVRKFAICCTLDLPTAMA